MNRSPYYDQEELMKEKMRNAAALNEENRIKYYELYKDKVKSTTSFTIEPNQTEILGKLIKPSPDQNSLYFNKRTFPRLKENICFLITVNYIFIDNIIHTKTFLLDWDPRQQQQIPTVEKITFTEYKKDSSSNQYSIISSSSFINESDLFDDETLRKFIIREFSERNKEQVTQLSRKKLLELQEQGRQTVGAPEQSEGGKSSSRKPLDKCTVAELKEKAKKRGVKVTGLKKDEILAKLRKK